jgi:hypothetical protein
VHVILWTGGARANEMVLFPMHYMAWCVPDGVPRELFFLLNLSHSFFSIVRYRADSRPPAGADLSIHICELSRLPVIMTSH